MFKFVITGLLYCVSGSFAQAEMIGAYYAEIGPMDYKAPDGTMLGTVGQVLQQDRANYHKFGIADTFDDNDQLFATPEARARIPALYAAGPRLNDIHRAIRRRAHPVVYVMVCGKDGAPAYLIVHFAESELVKFC